jgi:hypothetical protein
MKSLIAIALLISSQYALACGADGESEARIVGKISNLNYSFDSDAGQMEHFTYKIKIDASRVVQNPKCPLDIKAASQYSYWQQGAPSVQEGQEVSGVLVFNSKTNVYYVK